ncbi:uncharacterized protein PG986_007286 [Apiospora aurea]|uniref:Uncharacterized protein n=1 Tax=Apiospora aurea TaxID=335848 RepID=A0ABR1QCH6_9PEZI
MSFPVFWLDANLLRIGRSSTGDKKYHAMGRRPVHSANRPSAPPILRRFDGLVRDYTSIVPRNLHAKSPSMALKVVRVTVPESFQSDLAGFEAT